MSGLHLLTVSAAGGIGAVARYGAEELFVRRRPRARDVATALVNVTGCFAVGVVASHGYGWLGSHLNLATTGLLGGYTTFSGAIALPYLNWRAGQRARSVTVVVATALASALAFAVGLST